MPRLQQDSNGNPIQVLKPVSIENVSVSGTAASASVVDTAARVIRIVSDVDCFVNFEATATTSNGAKILADVVEYFRIDGSDVVSIITSGATGTVNISEMV